MQHVFKVLALSCCVFVSGTISDTSSAESTTEEDQDQSFHDSFVTSDHADIGKSEGSLAERLLFPSHDDSENSSEEGSDWIVSDEEDEYVDLKAMLAQRGTEEGKILYHPEVQVEAGGGGGGGGGVFMTDKELEDILSSPLIDAVCGEGEEGGVVAVKRVIAAHSNQYELDATDDKGM